ncbi:hypothetical protein ACFQS2_01235 [Brachybacterium sp. GCM10030267]|uniref:hypothetical protein n=1 Tax=Brachybacterium sp. GCM10030267 TaxID=3273381 RepID=UPI003612D5A9
MTQSPEHSPDATGDWEDEQIRRLVAEWSWASLLPATSHPVWVHAPGLDPGVARDALGRIARANAEVDPDSRPEIGLLTGLVSARRRREHRDRVEQWLAPYTRACERDRHLVRPLHEGADLAAASVVLRLDPAAERTVHDLLWRMGHHDDEDQARSDWLDLVVAYEEKYPQETFDGPA